MSYSHWVKTTDIPPSEGQRAAIWKEGWGQSKFAYLYKTDWSGKWMWRCYGPEQLSQEWYGEDITHYWPLVPPAPPTE